MIRKKQTYTHKKENIINPTVCMCVSHSVESDSLQLHRLPFPWEFPGKNTGMGCHFLLQGIFPIQGSNLGLLHCRKILHCLSHQGSLQYSSIAGSYYQYQQHHCCFYTSFWTSWAWNKDSVLLYSRQYCAVKYTKAQPLLDDTRMWQCMWTRELNYVTRHVNIHSHLWKFKTWRFVCRGLTVQ